MKPEDRLDGPDHWPDMELLNMEVGEAIHKPLKMRAESINISDLDES